mgnify:CR=1 FL=1
MKLTQELIDKIQEAMLHTKKDGSINWKDDDEIVVQLAGTFAADRSRTDSGIPRIRSLGDHFFVFFDSSSFVCSGSFFRWCNYIIEYVLTAGRQICAHRKFRNIQSD